jgi:hypothetical protein
MNWNLTANHLLEVYWKQRKWGKRNCLLPLPYFIQWALPPKSAAKNDGGYYTEREG